ncbi:MAG: CDP-alcohol phosphatidyltransferase family protein [Spirochaetales bacterium]
MAKLKESIQEKPSFTIKDLKSSLPPSKNRADSVWTRYVLRPLSYPFSLFFLRLGWSANRVSYFSALVAVIGGLLLCLPSVKLQLLGAMLLNVFAILDCVDGNIARFTHTTGPGGAWADALGGYVAYTATLLGAGMASEITSYTLYSSIPKIVDILWPRGGLWVLLGGVAASCNLLMRLAHQHYRALKAEALLRESHLFQPKETIAGKAKAGQSHEGEEEVFEADTEAEGEGSPSLEKRISENLGVTGLLMPALFVCVYTQTTGLLVLFYCLLYGGGAFFSLFRLARKIR